jgi:hypothetical protein
LRAGIGLILVRDDLGRKRPGRSHGLEAGVRRRNQSASGREVAGDGDIEGGDTD